MEPDVAAASGWLRPVQEPMIRRALLLAETALAALLVFPWLGRRSFWLDESASVTIAKLDWSSFVHVVRTREANMSLYHLLLSGWIRLGQSEFAVRSLSAIAALLTVPILYLLVKRLAGTPAALLSGLLLVVNPMYVRYAQEARGYALCLLLVTLASYLFVRGLDNGGWGVWLAYGLVAALAAYAHFFALLVVLAHAVSLLFVRRDLVPWRQVAAAGGLLCVLVGLLLYLLGASNQGSGIEWASGNLPGRIFTHIHDRRPLMVGALLAGLVLLVAGWALLRRLRPASRAAWVYGFLTAWLLVPLVVVMGIAVVYRPLFVVRYFIVCLPPLIVIAALLLLRIRWSAGAAAAAVVLVSGSLAYSIRWSARAQEEDWRDATRYVLASSRPGDGVLFYAPYVRIPFTLYLDRNGSSAEAPRPVYPADGWDIGAIKFNDYVPVTEGRIATGASRFRRVWLVVSHARLYGRDDPGYDAVLRGLRADSLMPVSVRRFTGIEVVRYAVRS